MNSRKFATFEASLAARPDIEAELAFILEAIEPPERKSGRFLPVAVGCAVVLGSASQALAHQARHVVVAGESLYRIAERELGSGSRWEEIAKLNHLSDPSRIQIGQVLEIPKIGSARRFSIREVHSVRRAETVARTAVQIVPAGSVVESLPGRSEPAPAANPAPTRRPRHFGTSNRFAWEAIDLSAFILGSLGGLRLLAIRRRARRSAAKVAARAVARTAASDVGSDKATEFWNYVPGSADLLALMASAS